MPFASRNKRFAIVSVGRPWLPTLPLPSGGIDTPAERAQMVFRILPGGEAAAGAADLLLADLTLAGTGVVVSGLLGTLSRSLAPLTLVATGSQPISGSAAITLDPLTLTASSSTTRTGQLAATLVPLTCAATATIVFPPDEGGVVGTATPTLQPLTLTAGTGVIKAVRRTDVRVVRRRVVRW